MSRFLPRKPVPQDLPLGTVHRPGTGQVKVQFRSNRPRSSKVGLWAILVLGLFLAGDAAPVSVSGLPTVLKVGPNYSRPSAEVAPTWIDADRPELKVRSTGSSTTLDEDRLSQILCGISSVTPS